MATFAWITAQKGFFDCEMSAHRVNRIIIYFFLTQQLESNANKNEAKGRKKRVIMIIHINQKRNMTESKYYHCLLLYQTHRRLFTQRKRIAKGSTNKEVWSERKINPFQTFFSDMETWICLRRCYAVVLWIRPRDGSRRKECWITFITMWYLILFFLIS